MLAITLWQPWASLVAAGVKPYEFRDWTPPAYVIGQRLAIHAATRSVLRGELQDLIYRLNDADEAWSVGLHPPALQLLERWLLTPGRLPRSSIVCTATLARVVPAKQIADQFGPVPPLTAADPDHWTRAWHLTDIHALTPPCPARGHQGLWHWQQPVDNPS